MKLLHISQLRWGHSLIAGATRTLVGVTMPFLTAAQDTRPAQWAIQTAVPAHDAHIASFSIAAEENGALHVVYSDGTNVVISKEQRRFGGEQQDSGQAAFEDIQVAGDRRHIGWLASYSICAQSYPCMAELVVYQAGHNLTHISPLYGIMWRWQFIDKGKQVAVHSGFPHGDAAGQYALYATDTGRLLATFSPPAEKTPKWVRLLQEAGE